MEEKISIWLQNPILAIGDRLHLKANSPYVILPDVTNLSVEKIDSHLTLKCLYRGGIIEVFANEEMCKESCKKWIERKNKPESERENLIIIDSALNAQELAPIEDEYGLTRVTPDQNLYIC